MSRLPYAPLSLAALIIAPSLAQDPPSRLRLFDHMDRARIEGLPAEDPHGEVRTTLLDFDTNLPDKIWFGRSVGRDVDWGDGVGALDPGGGLEGGCLRIGPGVPEDQSRAVLVLPSSGLARVTIRGRVRLEPSSLASDSALREALRVVEHSGMVEDPTRRRRWTRGASPHRVSRRHDPSGWDRFELTLITRPTTRCLELQLLHRSGGSADSVTRFDDLTIEEMHLGPAATIEHLRSVYRPRDGSEGDTPWRSRVGLGNEVRDALLLPPPGRLALPLTVPAAQTEPRLRFHYGMTPEAHRAEGDGAQWEVAFRSEDGVSTPLGTFAVDPKNNRDQRGWLAAEVDLTPVAGRTGELTFTAADVDDEFDALDTLLLATPRIEPARAESGAFNVLLIGVDTLRPDRMSAFGYERPTTPHLEALADVGVRFPETRSQAPWTLPSFSSILTSLYPSQHGAGRGGHDEWTPIDPTTTALAEILGRVGYETQGIVANGLISPHYGLDQGFEAYRWGWVMESAENDAPRVASFIEEHTTTPWLCFWHIMDPHLPYYTADKFREAFTDKDYDGRFKSERGAYVPFEVLDPRPGRRWYVHEGPPPAPELEDADRAFVHDYYDAEVAEMDAAVGRVLDALRASGQWERTIVAFIADHGEGLGDHGHYHHGYTLFEDQVHIPMILRVPGAHEGRVVQRPVAAIDLAPTILGALGMEVPDFFQGVDRLAQDAPTDDAYFIEYPTYDSSAQKAWVRGRFKYVHDPVFHTAALYDLAADPGERTDVSAEHPGVVAEARAALDEFRWRALQDGRYHLRLRGTVGQHLRVEITTDDLFDANFATRPQLDETLFSMDLDRKHLVLDTVLERDRLELVFWCRGEGLTVDVQLDGKPAGGGLYLGLDEDPERLPFAIERSNLPVLTSEGVLGWPDKNEVLLWQESGVEEVLPVVLSPQELEVLRELGYAR